MQNAKEIRKNIRESRRKVSVSDREVWNNLICNRFSNSIEFQKASTISGFLAFDGEADPLALMKAACGAGKQVFVPIIIAKQQPLKFAPWSPNAAMKSNRFGILEPDVAESDLIEGSQLDFVITPLVAFDESCNRIGVGGGFYDRTFAFLNESIGAEQGTSIAEGDGSKASLSRSTCLIGFAYELQKIASIKSNDWDVALAGVMTETDTYQRHH
ncbi:MAG: 5-formyltetrahydrofolate cyclo-ligase [Mariniblastus sp.]